MVMKIDLYHLIYLLDCIDKMTRQPREEIMAIRLVYIAAPYTGNKAQRDQNVEMAKYLGRLVAERGFYPVMPTVNTAGFEELVPQKPAAFWYDATLELMKKCDCILLAPNWQNSAGCVNEALEANKLEIPVFYNLDQFDRNFNIHPRFNLNLHGKQ